MLTSGGDGGTRTHRVRAWKAAAEGWKHKRSSLGAVTLLLPCAQERSPPGGRWACSDTGSVGPEYSCLPHFLREVGPNVQTTAKIPQDSVPAKGALPKADGGAHGCSTASSCSYCSLLRVTRLLRE